MRIERRLGIRSAYGQLILIVFLPIAALAMVGAVLVFFETTRAVKSEQDVLAQAMLIRYEPIAREFLDKQDNTKTLTTALQHLPNNPVNAVLLPQSTRSSTQNTEFHHRVLRVAILDIHGNTVASTTQEPLSLGAFDVNADSIWRQPTPFGTAYGMPILVGDTASRYWLFVDMDDEPLTIAYYRIFLSLTITGLLTILLLLLVLSIYSKRWITPIYELRLFLQRLQPNNLDQTLNLQSDGEFSLLQAEINHALQQLHASFQELQRHSEQTEADLQQAFDEMEMQTISIRRNNQLLKHASDTKSAFLANISHELRTPLNAIDGFVTLLARSDNLDNKQALYVQTIKKSSAHLLALINDVLDFSKMEAGKLILENQPFNLYRSIYEVADMLSPTAFEKGLRMVVLYYNDVPTTFNGDKLRVKQILTNLIGNALKFTESGEITISITVSENDRIRLAITDTGQGIDKTVGESLFESFSQGDASITRRYGGTGLGLMISKQLTHLMKGEIGFFDNASENVATHGTTFWFELPINVDDEWANDHEPIGGIFGKTTGKLFAWINHEPTQTALKMALAGSAIRLESADSLAKCLDGLANNNDYDWVIVDGHAQKGDLTALIGQVRRYYAGKLFVYGYQISTDITPDTKTFALYEPLDKEQLQQLITSQSTKNASYQPYWQNKTALIVDDTKANLLVLDALLSEFGISTIKANSGFDAIEVVNQHLAGDVAIDLIFMDISMPVMSGLEACQAIRRLENNAPTAKNLPIIALTAHGLPDDTSELVKVGLSDYATKPLSEHDLALLLQKWLGDTPSNTPVVPAQNTKNNNKNNELSTNGNLPIYDQADGLARAGNKPDLADNLLSMLVESLENECENLKKSFENNEPDLFSKIVHRLLGASRYTGTPMLRNALEALHNKAFNKTTDNWQDDLTNDYQAVLVAAEQLLVFIQNRH